MKKTASLLVCFLLLLSCVGEDLINDYVDPDLRISNPIVSINEGFQYQFKARFFDESGTKVAEPALVWQANPPTLATISQNGILETLAAGQVTVSVQTTGLQGNVVEAKLSFAVTAVAKTEVSDTTTATTDTTTSTSDTVISSTTDTATTTTDTASSTSNNTTSTTTDTASSTTNTSTATTETATSTSDTETTNTDTSTTDTATSTTDTSTTTAETATSTSDITTGGDSSGGSGVVIAPQFYEGEIISTSGYILEGNFRYEHNGTQITLSLDESYRASTSLPGLYLYLGNNPNTVNGAVEIGKVAVFNGAHEYILPPSIELTDYKYIIYWCKPFSVPVGEGTIF